VHNANLDFARRCGMQLHFIDRQTYRNKTDADFIDALHQRFGDFYLLPEGGSNALAVKGCAELVAQIDIDFDIITTACGTGATLAGLASGLPSSQQQAVGYAVLKGAGFLRDDVQRLLQDNAIPRHNWRIVTDCHFGGYGKIDNTLITFMQDFQRDFGITLDAVYTARMFHGLLRDIAAGKFTTGCRIVALHSGGLQGNAGFAQLRQRHLTQTVEAL